MNIELKQLFIRALGTWMFNTESLDRVWDGHDKPDPLTENSTNTCKHCGEYTEGWRCCLTDLELISGKWTRHTVSSF